MGGARDWWCGEGEGIALDRLSATPRCAVRHKSYQVSADSENQTKETGQSEEGNHHLSICTVFSHPTAARLRRNAWKPSRRNPRAL